MGYLLDLARARQASWINDVALAVYQGKATQERLTSLSEGARQRFLLEEPGFDFLRLKLLAKSHIVAPEVSERMLKQIEYVESGQAKADAAAAQRQHEKYLEFCKKTGIKP